MVAEESVTPLKLVVVARAHIEEDSAEPLQVVESVGLPIDHRIEAQPAVPDLLDQLAAREGHWEVDVERRVVGIR